MKRKVLIAEDEPEVLEYLGSYIPLLGYEVETAKDGLEALAKVNIFKPDLLLLDLAMPKLDGMGVLKEIRKSYADIKVLVVTGTRASEEELLSQGVAGVLYKPLDLTVLSERIKSLLPEIKQAENEYARVEIVEDEDDIKLYMQKEVLEPLGLEVITAQNAQEGFTLYKEKMPHIMIVDLACPNRVDGEELVRKLMHTPGLESPKSIIIQTAALGDTVESLKREGLPVFNKPIDWDRLKDRVLEACQKHGLKLKK